MIKKKNLLFIILVVTAFIISCRNTDDKALEKALKSAEHNKNEIESVLFNFKENKQKSIAIRFLISNMITSFSYDTTYLYRYRPLLYELDTLRQSVGNQQALNIINQKWTKLNFETSFENIYSNKIQDIQTVTSDFLIKDIEKAFESWQNSIFKDSIDYEIFKQYILPYRIKNGFIIEDWRSYFIERFGAHYNKYTSLVEVVDSVMNLINEYQVNWVPISNYPFLCLSDYDMAKMSKCPERCWFNAMLFRSLGLPCTIDYVPAWGNRNSGHEWNAIIINGKTYPFESTGGREKWKPKLVYNNEWVDESWMKSRLPKVFRYTYEINQEGPDIKNAPPLFRQRNYTDVSSEYFKTTNVVIENKYAKPSKDSYAYLCVFNEDRWKPIHWGKKIKRGKYEFKNMGRNIAYLPVFYDHGQIVAINDAFILDSLGKVHYLHADTLRTEQIDVVRKYLTRPDLDFWRKWNTGAYFESSSDKSFRNANKFFTVEDTEMRPTMWNLDKPIYTRFLRYTFADNHESLAELYVYTKDDKGDLVRINGDIIANAGLDTNQIAKILDDDILSYAHLPKSKDDKKPLWIGFDFGRQKRIYALGVCPRNDKNNIIKGLDYELFYWNKKWISLGIKTAKDYHLVFDNVPQNALLYVRCVTEGNENRIFTYEKNQQVWW